MYNLAGGLQIDVRFLLNLSVYQLVRMRKVYFCPLFTGILFFLSGNILPAQPPEITGQNTTPSIDEDTFIDIDINHLIVEDADSDFPTGFTLEVEEGADYTVEDARVTPALNFNGTLAVRLRVIDPDMEPSAYYDFQVDVSPVNDAPVIDGPVNPDVSIDEESTLTVNSSDLIISDPDNDDFTVTVEDGANYSAAGNTFTVDEDYFGPLTVRLSVNDGEADSDPFDLDLTVNNVNDPPTMNSIPPLNMAAGETQDALLTGLYSGADNEDDPLDVTIVNNSNPDLFDQVTLTHTSPNPEGTITFEAKSGASGSSDITVRLSDGQAFVEETFTVSVQHTNASPTLDPIANAEIDEDAPEQTVTLSGISPGAGEDDVQQVTIEAESNMPSVIPHPTVTHDGGSGELRYQPLPNQFTSPGNPVTITVRVRDNDASPMEVTQSFDVVVNSVNDQPVIDGPVNMDMSIDEESTITINSSDLVISDPDDDTFTVSIEDGANYSAVGNTFTVDEDYFGPLAIRLSVNDGEAESDPFDLTLTVDNVNDPPVMNSIAPLSMAAGETQDALLTGLYSGADNENDPLLVTIQNNSNPDLFDQVTVTHTSPNPEGTITFEAKAGASGSSDITVRLSDGQAFVEETFTVSVQDTNAPPTLDPIANAEIDEDAPEQTITLSGISPGAGENNIQLVTVEAESNMPSVIPNPTVSHDGSSTTGELRYQPLPNQFTSAGSPARITVRVRDNHVSPVEVTQSFDVVVNSVNDRPVIDGPVNMNLAIAEEATHTLNPSDFNISDPDDDTFTLTIVDGDNYSAVGNVLTPDEDYFGPLTAQVVVSDGEAESDPFSYTLTVNNVNDPPTMELVTNSLNLTEGQTGSVGFTGITTGAANENDNLSISIQSNSNPDLFSNITTNYVSPQAQGNMAFTAANNVSGNSDITVRLSDGEDFVDRSFVVSVDEVTAVPTIDNIPNQIIDEDAAPQVVNLTNITAGLGDEGQPVTVTATSSDPTIIPHPAISHSGANTTGTLTYQPVANKFGGPVTITVTVTDTEDPPQSYSVNFQVTVTAVNDPPTLNALSNIEIDENAGAQVVNLSGIGPGPEEGGQGVTVTAVSNNTALIPNPAVSYTSGSDGSISFTPVANQFGVAQITVTVTDDGGLQVSRSFTVTVNEINDPPTLNPIANLTIDEDAEPQTVNLTGISPGPGEGGQGVVITATSDNTALIPNPTVNYTSGTEGSISFTPVANRWGTAQVTVTVTDQGTPAQQISRTFNVTVNAVNDPPTLAAIPDLTINEGDGLQTVNLTGISPGPEEDGQGVIVSATSDNTTLIPNPAVNYSSGSEGSISFTPAPNQWGTAQVTVTVTDQGSPQQQVSRTFTVTVNEVNDPPTLNALSDITIDEDADPQNVNLTGISPGPGEAGQGITITATSSNTALIPHPTVNYTSGATGSITFAPEPDKSGTAQITVTVTDAGTPAQQVSRTFTVTVNEVNDPPVIVGQSAVSVDEDNNFTILVSHLIIEDPDHTSGFEITVQNGANYTRSGTVITPAPNYNGNLSIPITVSDGINSSAVFNFQLTVNPVNDPPVITGQKPISIDEEESIELTVEHLNISDPDDEYPGGFTLIVAGGANYTVAGATTIIPATNYNGVLEVPVFVNDGDANSNIFTLNITVNPVNDPPIITGQAVAISIAEDQSVVLALNQLNVTDPDNPPGELTLHVQDGTNYTFSGLTVTPAPDFNGPLHVTVVVSDGELMSAPFNMLVTVTPVNDPPEIVGQNPVTTTEDTPVTLSLADLVVEDPDADDPYPDAFTLIVFEGDNYTVDGLTVTPAPDFTGTLSVGVEVSDGVANSNRFNLQIQVTDENDVPVIVSQDPKPLVIEEDTPVTILLSHLTVTDTDNVYPDDFSIVIQSGANYTYSGATVTPALDYTGTLIVTLRVNDGQNNSASFPFEILVVDENDPPTITGQKPLSVAEDQPLEIKLTDLTVTDPDPDDVYPDDFTLIVLEGTNYTVDGTTILPAPNYFGPLSVPVRVSDGVEESATFNLVVTVTPVNDPPSFAPIANVSIPENTEDYAVQITGISPGPLETQNMSISVSSSNESLLPRPTFSPAYNGTASTATILLNPVPNKTGIVTVTVTVIDQGLLEFSRTFTVEIEDINAAPTLDPIAFGPLPEDSPVQTIPLTGISAGPGENQVLTLSAVADKPELFETFTWTYTSPQPTGSLTILPKPNVYGDVVITVTVTDDGSNEPPHVNFITQQFTLEITPVPDAPMFLSEPTELALIGEPYEYAIDVADADPGAVITIEAAQIPPWLSLTQVSNGKATLSGTPPPGSAGSELVSLKATDETDLEVFQNFTLTVDARPVVSDFSINAEEDVPRVIEKIRFDAAFTDADNDFIQAVKIVTLPPNGQLFVGTQAINEGQEISATDLANLTYRGLQDYYGQDTIVWNGYDGRSYAIEPAKIFITIAPVNDPPVIVSLEATILTVNAGEGPVQISTEFEVKDVDNELLTGAEIGFRRQNFVAGDDLLMFEDTPKITGSYDPESGILTLTGTATVAEYNAAIRSIRYDNVSSVFSSEEVIKTISYTVSDGTALSVTRDREIRLIDTFEELLIPNGFTPNSDGDNDLWLITNLERHVDASVRVYTIMGQIVYESDGVYTGWDGTYNGQLLPADTYYYTIDLNLPFRKKVYKGAVTLLRQ